MERDEAIVILKQPAHERVIKRSMSSSALQAAQNIQVEFMQNLRSQISLTTTGK